jgi:5'-deoxynucleotidase YfbR-like HD superfamily hydrolase
MDWRERIGFMRDAGEVTRLHTVNTIHRHTVAEHVYGAQVIALELCRLNLIEPGRVLLALLEHDAAEVETGDVPAPTKRANADIKTAFDLLEDGVAEMVGFSAPVLTSKEQAILKAADWLDLAYRCLEERRLGNRNPRLQRTFLNIMDYTAAFDVQGVSELRTELVSLWTELLC